MNKWSAHHKTSLEPQQDAGGDNRLASDLDPFMYKSLGPNPNAIRLLVVKKVEAEGHVHCSLGHSCLQSCGEFHALSYEWGHESAMQTILVNGKPLQIRQNLWQFLRRAESLEWLRGLPLWVDAICIDQGTIGERNHQVRLMSRIYAHAQTVIAWVGFGDNSMRYLLRDLRRLYERKRPWDEYNTSIRKKLLRGVETFSSLPYWSRMWIIQELLLAKCITLMYGKSTISWTVFWATVGGIQRDQKIVRPDAMTTTPAYQHRLQWLERQFREAQPFAPLNELLLRYATSQCLDIRDRVIALLSLAQGGSMFKPDYGDSAARLAVRAWAHFKGGSELLARLGGTLRIDTSELLHELDCQGLTNPQPLRDRWWLSCDWRNAILECCSCHATILATPGRLSAIDASITAGRYQSSHRLFCGKIPYGEKRDLAYALRLHNSDMDLSSLRNATIMPNFAEEEVPTQGKLAEFQKGSDMSLLMITAQVAHMQTRTGCAGRFRWACGTYEIAEFDMLVVGASKFSLRRWFEAYKREATVFTYANGMYAATADPDVAERMKLPDLRVETRSAPET
ncbi:hypothetical protein LTR70_005927 [Exophiala xenobiotica]|uniref:Heterokaryon incompatibility domain-containing protein n=1 Tax=Lithohypha guttulata TaxID=1690604 RepID=A0ABR0K6V4_9EURO|nr:hypothetical protein LTR24_006091 [Lithohypha guttulata]KAK5317309.1 hypothetical protein LTR70_005927 [Exophiala xenobiotica]